MIAQFNTCVGWCNQWSETFWQFNWGMLIQVSILVLALVCVDLLIKPRARAITRYWLWTLVLAKLLLPLQVGTPVSLAYWIAPPATTAANSDANINPVAIRHDEPVPSSIDTIRADVVRPPVATRRAAMPAGHLPASQRFASTPSAVRQVAAQKLNHLHWKAYLLLGWASIVAILIGLITWKALAVRQIVRTSCDATEEFRPMMAPSLKLLGMRQRSVRVRVTERLSSPAICGFWKPTILLPNGLTERLESDQLRLVFVHELAHWTRFDLQFNCLQTFLQVLYFYNPAVWFANAMLRRLREAAVDETVLVATRSGPQQYGNTLLDVAAAELTPAELTLRLIGVVESRRQLAAQDQADCWLAGAKNCQAGTRHALRACRGRTRATSHGGKSVQSDSAGHCKCPQSRRK